MSIINKIKDLPHLHYLSGASEKQIKESEIKLGLIFAEEYKEYLKEYGIVSYEGHELTGICDFERLNVVDVTIENKKHNHNVPDNLYVIEECNFDGFVIWQDENGQIYETQYESEPKGIYNSLSEYLSEE